mmetsp:Transcript_7938/g.22742  ORF Transcript_7938/g.22742 Transcript_7938/m.22742 type:complete len:202 (+) Transcript_7938:346-951(+)
MQSRCCPECLLRLHWCVPCGLLSKGSCPLASHCRPTRDQLHESGLLMRNCAGGVPTHHCGRPRDQVLWSVCAGGTSAEGAVLGAGSQAASHRLSDIPHAQHGHGGSELRLPLPGLQPMPLKCATCAQALPVDRILGCRRPEQIPAIVALSLLCMICIPTACLAFPRLAALSPHPQGIHAPAWQGSYCTAPAGPCDPLHRLV